MKRHILNLLPKFFVLAILLSVQVVRSQCPLTYYTGIGVANSGTNFATWASFGPGQYFAWPVLYGGSYALSTCGAPICTQLTGYDNSASSIVFLNNGNGPLCSNCNASIDNFVPNFTGYAYVQLTQYNCIAGGSSSINLYLRQNDNLSFTSSSAAMCSGQTRVLSATPANVGSTPGGYGDPGTFYGTGVSGNVFTAPVVASPTNYTISYVFGYVTETQVITVNPIPTVVANTTDGSICKGSSTTLFGSGASTYTWTGGVTNNVPFAPTVTGTYFVTGTSAAGCTSTNSAAQTITVEPTLSLTGNGNNVPIGVTTNTNNNTNFGTNTSRTFSVSNTGAGTLTLGTIFFTGPNAGAFSITTPPSSTAITTGTTGFVITLTPTNTGVSTATVNIPSNHCGATYSFVITASTTAASALGFDGINDVISTPNINLNNQSFTIEFWAKRNSLAGPSYLIGQNNSNTVNQSLHIGFRNNSGFTFAFWGNDLDYTVTPNFDNNWHHWACVYNSASAGIDRFIYMDGQLVASDNSSSNYLAPSTPVLIGSGNGFPYTGFADEVRIWNTARSQCQIQQFMNCEIPSTSSGLLANYHFNQGIPSGNNSALPYNVLTDATGTNNGSLAGFALTGATSNWISPGGVVSGFTTAASITASLAISGNGNNVPIGNTTSTGNNTDFGVNTSRTFSISNPGSGTLYVNNIYLTGPNANQFSLTTLPTSTISTGTTGFAITLTPTNTGISTATVFINSSDCTNPTYSFVITASTTPANALSFNGAQYFVTPALGSSITSTSNITLETWFKPTGPGVIVNELGSPSIAGVPSGWHDTQIEVVGTGSVFVRVWNVPAVFVGTVSYGTWNHVAMRYNHNLGITDGVLNGVPSTNFSSGTRFAPSTLYYGLGMVDITNMGSGAYFTGQMDEFRVWNTHRSVCEIQQYMNCEIPTTATGLVANYHFNQGVPSGSNIAVTTATDAANGNTATLSGFALTGSASNWVNPGAVIAGSITPATIAASLTLKGNGNTIPQGNTTSTSNNTDWGSSTSKTFSISNAGSGTLNIGNIYLTGTNASNFSLTTLPSPAVTSGTTGFVVTLSPTNTGISTATVNIISNDCSYPNYTFVITASTTPASALDFDGVDDYVSVPHSAALSPTNALSVELWVKPTTTVGTQYLLSKGTDDLVNGQYGIILANGAPSFHFYNNAHVGAGSSTYTLTNGAWTHLAGTWDGTTCNLYANGLLIASSSVTAALPVNTGPLQIGRLGKPSFIYPSNAQFDEVRIWNTGRTQCQIQQYMNCEITSTASGLVANYHFNEGIPAGTNTVVPYNGLSDTTGSFPGTLNNFALTGTVSNWVSPGGVISGSNTPASITSSLLVSGNGNTVPMGNTTSTGNNTDFGTNASRTFSISNPGGGTLYINSVYLTGPNVNQFSITTQPATSVSSGSTGFAITLTPTNTGISTATVFVNSNDCTNPTFSFVITASTTPASALSFDGNNDYVTVPNAASLQFGTGDFTNEAWIKYAATAGNYAGIIVKGNSGTGIFHQLVLFNDKIAGQFYDGVTVVGVADGLIGTTSVNNGVWHHVAMVRKGSNVKLYVDGIQEASVTHTLLGTTMTSTNNLFLGTDRTASVFFPGQMDEVRLWNTARTQCEIQTYMNAEITSTASGLVANYHFNQGIPAGTNTVFPYNTLADAAGTNNGTLNNMLLTGATSNWVSPGGVTNGFTTTSAPSVTVAAFGNGNSIPAGSTTPTVSNNTSFGNLCVGGSTVSKTYSVSNTGTNVLNINIVLSGSSSYTLGTYPATLAAGGSTTFPITFNPGTATAIAVTTVNVYSNDCANPNYSFVINATVNPLPVVSASTSSTAICIGQSVTLNGSGANTYTWVASSGSATNNLAFSPTTTASYSVTGTSTAGCTSTNVAALSVTVNPLPTLTISGTGTICNTFGSTLTASGASTYAWNTGPTTASVALNPTSTTVYTATGTDINSCINSKSFTITVNPLPVVSASTNSTVICFGQSVTLNGGGANTYTWLASSGTATNNVAFTPTTTASYSVTGTSTAGCTSTNVAAVTVTVNALPVVSASTNSTVICFGQSVTLNGSGADTYTWNASLGTATNNVAFTPTATANYSVTGTSTLTGCTSTNVAAVTVTVNALPTVTPNTSSPAVCIGQTVSVFAFGANTFTWLASAGSNPLNGIPFTPTATTSYSVSGTNIATGCTSTNAAVVTVSVNPLPTVALSGFSICAGTTVTLSPTGAATYSLYAGTFTANGITFAVTPSINTSYSVIGASAFGCVSSNTAVNTVTVNGANLLATGNSNTILAGSNTPTTSNFTDFGSGVFTRTLVLQNTGVATLSITSVSLTGANAGDFTITSVPSSTIASASNSSLVINFIPTALGSRNATVNINSNSCGVPNYSFVITGSAVAATALNFNNNFLNITKFPVTFAYTMEFWFKSPLNTSPPAYTSLVSDNGMDFVINNSVTARYGSNNFGSNFTLTPNTWYHFAYVYDAIHKYHSLYINGNLGGNYVLTSNLIGTHSPSLTIGSGVFGSTQLTIDEFRVWNYARTQCEIQSSMNAEIATSSPSLSINYHFNQGIAGGVNSGTFTANDASGNNATGTLSPSFLLTGTSSNWVSGTITPGFTTVIVPGQEINIIGNGNSIAKGDFYPQTSDFTDFGSGVTTRTFVIQNTGTAALNISSYTLTGAHASEFSFAVAPPTSIAASGSASFVISFANTTSGIRMATVTINNNDCDEALFDFGISAGKHQLYIAAFGGTNVAKTNITSAYTCPGWLNVGSNPTGVAIDNFTKKVYYANGASGNIGVVNMDGTSQNNTLATGIGSVTGLAIDPYNGVVYFGVYGGSGGVKGISTSGGSAFNVYSSSNVLDVDVNPFTANYYFIAAGSNSITSVNLNTNNGFNGGPNPSFITGCNSPTGLFLDAKSNKLYWANNGNGTIGSANLDGTGVNQSLVSGVTGIKDLIVDRQAGVIFYTSSTGVGSVNINGTGLNTSFQNSVVSGTALTWGIAVGGYLSPTLAVSASNTVSCASSSVALTATTNAATYTWSSGANTLSTSVSPTATTVYTLTVTDAQTCTLSATQAVSVNPVPSLTLSTSANTICAGSQVTFSASGANTHVWTGSVGNGVAFTPSATGIYTVTGTFTSTGCFTTATQAVTVQANPTVNISSTSNTICNTFTPTLTATGAVTYTWNTGPTTSTIAVSPSVSTIYTATGTGTNSCTNTNTFALTVNPLPTVTANSTATYICINNNITLNGSGANTYTWTSTAAGTYTNGVSFTPTTTATYSVVGTSTNGCVSSNTSAITVTVNPLPVVSAATSTAVICIGGTTSVNGSGANTYTWTGGIVNSVTFAPTSTQTYSLSGTNTITGCTSTNVANVTVTVNPLPTLTVSGSALICNGGGVTLTASGANTYSWSNSVNNASVALTPSVTTPYTVTATDINLCVNSAVKTVTVNSLPTVTASVSNSVICAGASVTVNGSGAVTYTWNASSGTATNGIAFAPASTASYSLVGTNAAGCTSTNNAVVSVTVNALPVLSIAGTPSICNGASRNFSVSGANTYVWNTSSTSSVITVSPSSNTNYSVTGTNTTTSCQNTVAITLSVTQLPTVTASATSSVICINGTTSLSAGGAITYTWSSATATIANLATISPTTTTSYTVIGTNTAGCSSTNTAVQTITVNPLPVVTANASNTYICINTSVTVNGSGANTYTWTTTAPGSYSNAVAFVPTITATYSLAGTSTAGCTSTNNAVVTITVNSLPVITIAGTPTICNGASTTFSASGADTYTWNTSANTASINAAPNANTVYTVNGTNTLTSCQGTAGITLSVSPLPTVAAAASNTVICYGNTVTLNGSGANSYAWTASTGTATDNVPFTPTSTANYTVVGTSTAGCTSTNVAVVTITVNQLPVVVAAASNTFICINASVTVNGSGANTYTWTASTGAVTNNLAFTPTTTATYSLAGTSTAGCTSTNVANVTITVNPLPIITPVASSSAICLGASLTLSGAGASTYTWTALTGSVSNNVAFSPTITQTYSVTGTNSNSCVNSNTISIPVYQNPTVSATASTTFICIGNSVTLNGAGANTYTWTASTGTATDNTAFTPTATASYSVVGTSTDGCVSNNTVVLTVTVNPLPTLSITATKTVLCLGDSTSFVASGALTYTWSPVISNGVYFRPTLTATSYTVDATDLNGCKNSATKTITVNPLPVLSVAPSVSASCSGQSTTLTATGATSYSWSLGAATGSIAVFAPTVSATYTLTGMDNNGCISVLSFSQPVNPCTASNTAYANVTPASCKGKDDGKIIITALNPTYTNNTISYVWNPNALCPNNNCDGFTNLLAGNYAVKVIFTYTVASNLVRVDTIAINNIVVADGTAACDLTPFTGVTPNNDGKNDKWEISNIGLYPNNRVTVYNRYGIKVADFKNYNNENNYWPQVQSIDKLAADTYFYVIDPGDGTALIKGWVELIKE